METNKQGMCTRIDFSVTDQTSLFLSLSFVGPITTLLQFSHTLTDSSNSTFSSSYFLNIFLPRKVKYDSILLLLIVFEMVKYLIVSLNLILNRNEKVK